MRSESHCSNVPRGSPEPRNDESQSNDNNGMTINLKAIENRADIFIYWVNVQRALECVLFYFFGFSCFLFQIYFQFSFSGPFSTSSIAEDAQWVWGMRDLAKL